MRYAKSHCTKSMVYGREKLTYVFSGPCRKTGKTYRVEVLQEELEAYANGALIQYALKSVNAADREFLMTGYSPEGWIKEFSFDGEE